MPRSPIARPLPLPLPLAPPFRSRLALLALLALVACGEPAAPAAGPQAPQAPTNRIAVPEAVRKNLGIVFVTVARRRIAQTLRFPGSFELLPTGKQEVRAPVP